MKQSRLRFGYHGTWRMNLSGIAARGLLPFDTSKGRGVFFVAKAQTASRYGDVVLRFPWPGRVKKFDVEPDPYYRTDGVEAEVIEVLVGGEWLPVTDFYEPEE